ncbi:LamG-like jellyroll fold domain-containing protein [Roseimarinus sediminis]|uniref:LamG-like jellyroll fold domain-containing protein n=1 Tax=Roseimarinus sediminis TaxID=1610899 RepID=UPI003D246FC7
MGADHLLEPYSSQGDVLCPSAASYPSTRIFRITADQEDLGDPGANLFEWYVYGGTIINYSGSIEAAQSSEEKPVSSGINLTTITLRGVDGTDSWIEVQWDEANAIDAWIAVRQSSEWLCSDGLWRVFEQEIGNEAPVFGKVPADISLPFAYTASAYSLPLPEATDDACCTSPLIYTYVVDRPVSGPTAVITYNPSDLSTLNVYLEEGENEVSWTVSDGARSIEHTYTITVEPVFDITNVAWTSTTCDADNGMAFVSQLTPLAENPNRTIEYKFNSDDWNASSSKTGLAPNVNHTVQARLVYSVDPYADGNPVSYTEESNTYTFQLAAYASQAVDKVLDPEVHTTDISLVATSCGNNADGRITMNPDAMLAQNRSLQFNGSSDYLLLNKNYTTPLSEFTLAAWVKTTANDGTILSFDKNVFFSLGVSGGQLQLSTTSTDGQSNSILVDGEINKINNDEWHLVVATFGTNAASDVVYDIYRDGVAVETAVAHNGSGTIGRDAALDGDEWTRYGAIGAVLRSSAFEALGQAYFFSGSLAEVGIWNVRLTPEQVLEMKRNGMVNTAVAMTDHFAFNNLPSNVNVLNAVPNVLTDVASSTANGSFARFYNASALEDDAPKLYSWNDDLTLVSTEREGLSAGEPGYVFNVSDIFGCGKVDNAADPYVIPNGDESDPYLLWNVAIEKEATQSTLAAVDVCGTPMNEGMAVDGNLESICSFTETETEAGNEPWWQVNLGNSYPLNRVRIHAHQALAAFDVLVSPIDFPAGRLADDWLLAGVTVVSGTPLGAGASADVIFPANTNGSFVRIRLHDDTGTEILSLNEVEVLTAYPDPDLRQLYLADECTYTINGDETTIDPVPVDDCGELPQISYQYTDPQTAADETGVSLVGSVWSMDYYTVNWTAVDENGNTGTLTTTYDVVDEAPPYFNDNPFDAIPDEITWCDALEFTLPIPDVDDNNRLCNHLQSLTLLRNNTVIYTVPGISTYPVGKPENTPVLAANMLTGTYDYTWRVVDASGNEASRTLSITTQQQPILSEVKYSPITCQGSNNGRVYFSKIDVEPDKDIVYILKSTTGTQTEYTHTSNVFTVTTDPVVETDLGIIPANDTYQAWLEVDGCRTPTAYPQDLVIRNPQALYTVNDITHVLCFGDDDGAIDVDPRGGNGAYALHLIGESDPATYVSAPAYPEIQLGEMGMIEAWVYIDSIADGGINWNAGIFGLPNNGNGYGFRMADGDLQFYVGGEFINVDPVDHNVIERTWIYLRGEWNGSDVANTPYLTFEISTLGTNSENRAAAFAADAGADNVYIGSLNDGDDTHNLKGFVRFARIWNEQIDAQTIAQNLYLASPIDPDNKLVANYPMSGGATTSTVSNSANPSQAGAVIGDYLRQAYAYYWLAPDGSYVGNEQDIAGHSAGIYTLTLIDPYGCEQDFPIEIDTRDEIAPVLNFYSDNARSNPLPMGDPIIRYTSQSDGGNTAGNCEYIAYNDEFNPRITDGTCDPDEVDITYAWLDGDLFVDDDAEAGNDPSDLDTRVMTGISTLRWTANDGANTSTREISYYIVDDTEPTDPVLPDVYLSMPDDDCEYLVTDTSLDPDPTSPDIDNCGTGILTNDLNGTATLEDHTFDVGTYTVTWTYTDREFPGVSRNEENTEDIPYSISFTQNIIVEDNTAPVPSCKAAVDIAPLQLDINGDAFIDYLDVDQGSSDNCVDLDAIVITKDISDDISTTNTISPDANPYWEVAFNTDYVFTTLSLQVNEAMNEYWVLVSNTGTFEETGGDLLNPQWGDDVVYYEYYNTGDVSGAVNIPIDRIADPGSHLRIWRIPTSPSIYSMDIDVVEIFGTSDLANATEFTFTCDDVRYIAGATVRDKGDFSPINILLSAIDIHGNVGSCMTQVTVRDDEPPVVITQSANIEVHPDMGGTINLNDYIDQIDNGSYDNCYGTDGIADRWITPEEPITCSFIGSLPVTLHVVDQHGNPASKTETINIVDGTEPNIAAYASISLPIGPDGYYVVRPEDILEVVEDNCTDLADLVYTIDPDTVFCADIKNGFGGFIDLSISVTDRGNNTATINLLREDEIVLVEDLLEPTFSLSSYTHTIPSTGSAPIYFDDIVKDGNLHDNCTDRADLLRYIRYEDDVLTLDPDEWCGYGNEGGGTTAVSNLAGQATVTGSTALSGHSRSYVNDDNPAGYTTASNMTYYATSDVAGTRTIQYNFAKKYEFDNIEVLWADIAADDGNEALSHDGTYMDDTDITTGGSTSNSSNIRDDNTSSVMTMETGTAAADAFWVQYEFSQPVMVANCRLRWGAGSSLEANSTIEYEDPDNPGTWISYGTIENTTAYASILTINAAASIEKIRLSYDPANGNTPVIAEWYVYGQACSPYAGKEVVSVVDFPGEILVSHDWEYLESVDMNDGGNQLDYINDGDDAGDTYYYVYNQNSNDAYGEWIEYQFYNVMTFTSTEIYWTTRNDREASAAKIQWHDGNQWQDAGAIGTADDAYRTLDLSGISSDRLRVAFTTPNNYDYVRLRNWRVYAAPCASATIPSLITDINEDDSYLEDADVYASADIGDKDHLRDGNTNSQWVPNTSGSWESHWVQYNFKEEIVFTGYYINWRSQNTSRLRNVEIQYEQSPGVWADIVSIYTPGNGEESDNGFSVQAQSFRINLDVRDNAGIDEWSIDGYPSTGLTFSDCWVTQPATLYNCPTVSTQLPILRPTTATVEYSDDGGTSWSTPVAVGTTAFPAGANDTDLDGGNPVEANALRLTFDNSAEEGNIGLYEFRTFGRRIPQTGDETVIGACITHDCTHVHKDITVHLKAVDESGREGIETVIVPVEPYFDIYTIDIKDCGFTGERYYPTITGLSGNQTYSYTWQEIQDRSGATGTGSHQSLFLRYTDYDPDDCPRFNNQNDTWTTDYLTTYTMPVAGIDWIELLTSGCSSNLADGNRYRIRLDVVDNNTCYDFKYYDFEYIGATSSATSIDSLESCVGDEETYQIKFAPQKTWLQQSSCRFYWDDINTGTIDELDELEANGLVTVIDGGASFGDAGTSYGDYFVTLRFDKSTKANGDATTDLIYSYKARGLHPFWVSTDSIIRTAGVGGQYESGYFLLINDSVTGGPYFTADTPLRNQTVAEGRSYIRVSFNRSGDTTPNDDSYWWYGDYDSNCLETRKYRITVHEVAEPIIEATYDIVPDGSSTWYEFTGDPLVDEANFPICVRDTITYRVKNYEAAEFAYLDWNFESEHAEPVPTGRRLAGGNAYDQTIQMVWDVYSGDPAYMPRLTVRGYNELDCTGDVAVVTHTFNDVTPPVISIPADVLVENELGQCGRMFTNIPPPEMSDECGRPDISRIENYWCDIDFQSDGTADIEGRKNAAAFYPVGVHTITWYAVDYSGNITIAADNQYTLTVLDTEAPAFTSQPGPVGPLYTSVSPGENCTYLYTAADPNRDVPANDVCEGAVTPVANIWHFSAVDDDYTILDPVHVDVETLHGVKFPVGKSKVVWTANDGVDNSAHTGYTADGNEASVEFIVTVIDDTPPGVADDDLGRDGIQLEPITVNTNVDQPGATFDVIVGPDYLGTTPVTPDDYTLFYPGYDTDANITDPLNLFSDNCSSDFSSDFISRSDGELNETIEFPVGTTTIRWRIFDFPGNRTDVYQDVMVLDTQTPEFRDNADANVAEDFADRSITYCQRSNYRIPIPRTYWDNVQVEELAYTVVNNTTGATVLSGSLLHSASPNFTVGGVPYLTAFNFDDASLDVADRVDEENGTDYTISWTAIDGATPAPFSSAVQTYNLRIQMQPRFNHATTEPIDCGGDQARITVDVAPGATDAESMDLSQEHFIRYEGYPLNPGDAGAPEFNIGFGWQNSPVFDFNVSGDNEFTVRMRVNGCEAPDQITVSIVAPEAVILDTEVQQHASCPENKDAALSASMSGGVPGQPHFTNGTQNFTVSDTDYDQLDITSAGAIEAWVYLDAEGSAVIVNKGTAFGLKINHDGGSGESYFAVFADGDELQSTYAVTSRRWYHVAGWWDASGLSIRVDKVTTDSQAGSYSATANNEVLTIGGTGFTGIIRDLRVWDLSIAGHAFATGDIFPGSKLRGDETGLMGYWDMGEGQGNAANKRVGFGNDALPSDVAIWADLLPQPGIYTWERLAPGGEFYQTFSLLSDQSNLYLQELEVGSYRISYVDQYGCAASNTSFKLLYAVDNELPEYTYPVSGEWAAKVATITTDEDVCTATLSTQELANLYTPDISDVDCGDCEFQTNWRVVYTPTNELLFNQDYHSDFIDQALINAVLKNQAGDGTNVVRIMVSQNGLDNFDEPEEYIIQLIDDQDPEPVGKFNEAISLELNNTPNGGGTVTLNAADFDNGSDDNCTKDPELLNPRLATPSPAQIAGGTFNPNNASDPLWVENAPFDCDDVGNTVQLYYQVTDESGRSSWITEATEIVVRDLHPPVFLSTSQLIAGECATVNADNVNLVPAYTLYGEDYPANDIRFNPDDFTDNCDVVHARFKLKYLWDGDMAAGNISYTNNDYDTFGYPAFDAGDQSTWTVNLDPTVDSEGNSIAYYDGTTEVYFELTDKSGNRTEVLVYTVLVLPKPTPGAME